MKRKKKNRHIQSVNIYLWYKKEYDFDLYGTFIVEGKIPGTRCFSWSFDLFNTYIDAGVIADIC
jgi:hypothetical protein